MKPMKKLLAIFNTTFLKWATIFTFAFIALYPKLPSIHVTRTWVYVRLEDFLISFLVLVWVVLVLRKKAKLPFPLGWGIVAYWVVGLLSLVVSITVIAPHLVDFIPKIAALEYLRRIEYMVLFFIAFSTVKSIRDLWHYLYGLVTTVSIFVLYGVGQHFYLYLWQAFPKFFEKITFCFPSFQTGNEEFAKGVALCLPENARITSTFGGHYDLAAYLVVVLPVLFVVLLSVKKKIAKVGLGVLFVFSTMILIFTSSRISFLAYLVGISATLVWIKRKRFIVPVWIISVVLLLLFSGSLAKRFLQTIRVASVVTNNQGQVVGVTESSLPSDLRNKISSNDTAIQANQPVANGDIPAGTAFNILPQNTTPVATSVAVVKNSISLSQAQKLRMENGGLEISTVSGSFLVQKALVYDISFTTRFQGEWPHAWAAFMTFPPLGTGYSSITLATDNDYLRLLGESGFLGFLSFLGVFFMLGVFLKESKKDGEAAFPRAIGLALAGGVVGLLINGVLIDVFEASKVAESLWILLGVGAGALALTEKKNIPYLAYPKRIFMSRITLAIYFLIATFVVYGASIGNFFIGDDFTWLKWAASSTPHDAIRYFFDAQGFFYRPFAKLVLFGLYTFFSFQPFGYHVFDLLLQWLVTLGVFFLGLKVFKDKFWAAVSAFFFLVLPSSFENVFWIAAFETNLAVAGMVYGLLAFIAFREKKNFLWFFVSVVLGLIAVFSYEMAVIFPLLIILVDTVLLKKKIKKNNILLFLLFFALDGFYFLMRMNAHAFSAGGDYSFKLSHLVQNVVGNVFGYISFFAFGESALGFYSFLRTGLRMYAGIFGLFVLFVAIGVGYMLFVKKTHIRSLFVENTRAMWFAILFILSALLPFVGLGNISPRYGYLASIGFVFLLCMFLKKAADRTTFKTPMQKYSVIVATILVILGFFVLGVQATMREWKDASAITLNTLKYFRVYHEDLPKGTTLYVANMPIRNKNAWVFPVGFKDALWFIYRDDTMVVNNISLGQAQQLAKSSKLYPYVFAYDTTGTIRQLK